MTNQVAPGSAEMLSALRARGFVNERNQWTGWMRLIHPWLGGHLRRFREAIGAKQAAVAEGESNSPISKLESGEIIPTPDAVARYMSKLSQVARNANKDLDLSKLIDLPPQSPVSADVELAVAAARAAQSAGDSLREGAEPALLSGLDKSVRTSADKDAHKLIVAKLKDGLRRLPSGVDGSAQRDFALFGEEQTDIPDLTDGILIAVTDPLDGTVNRAAGMDTYTVGVAFCTVLRGKLIPVCAAIGHPPRCELFLGIIGAGAGVVDTGRLTFRPLRPRQDAVLSSAVIATHLTSKTEPMLDFVHAPLPHLCVAARRVLMLGSGLLQLAWTAAGRLDAFVQPVAGGSWDIIPGAILVMAAGGTVSTFGDGDGDVFDLRSKSVLAAGNEALHQNLKTVLAMSRRFPHPPR